MASVRPRGTERGASAEECYRIDESNRIPTAHHHQSNCITRHVRSLDHYSSALLYSCLYSALDTLPCALLVLYRLYPRRATPPGARHLHTSPRSDSHRANPAIGSPPESETAGAAARKLHARKHVTPKGRRSQEEEAGGRGGIFSLPGSRFTTGFITTTDATF